MKGTRGFSGWHPCASGGGIRVDLRARAMSLSTAELSILLQRVAASLDRVASSVRRVRIRVADVNGDKGGLDKRCSVQVWLRGRGKVEVSSTGETIWQALSSALASVKRRCHEQVARRRHPRRNQGLPALG